MKKRLDRIDKPVYNIFKKGARELTLRGDIKMEQYNNNHVNIKNLADKVKENLPEEVPFCIAGGAVRDAYWNRLPKDFDVFILSDNEDNLERASFAFDEVMAGKPNLDYAKDPNNFKVYNCWTKEDYDNLGASPTQLISRKETTIDELIASFDYELVKCYYDPITEEFVYTPDFLKAIKKNEITVDNDTSFRRAQSCLSRLNLTKVFNIKKTYKTEKKKTQAKAFPDPIWRQMSTPAPINEHYGEWAQNNIYVRNA